MISVHDLKENLVKLKDNIHQAMDYLDFQSQEQRIRKLEKEVQQQSIWENNPQKAGQIQADIISFKEQKKQWLSLKKQADELFLLIKELRAPESQEGEDLSQEEKELAQEVAQEYEVIKKKYDKLELEVYLGKKYDKKNAIMFIYAGAGGIDAQDWAKMLLRMYQRYCEKKNFKISLKNITNTEEGGIKNAELEIKGTYAYGILKNEAGVHRLIRISPFSAQSLRHTSFASVEILPKLDKIDLKNLKIKASDLQFDMYKASGPGGQNVNRRETAVRVTHLPTNIQAASQTERSQGVNRERALNLLMGKLVHLLEQKNLEKIEALKDKVSPEWGNQIRTYVLHPYKQVRDHRTGLELSKIDKVLDGDLEELIEANLKKNINS
jgi:peptide chain release factor 2